MGSFCLVPLFYMVTDTGKGESYMKIIDYNEGREKKILCLHGLYMNGECFSDLAAEMPEYQLVCVTYDSFHYGSGEFESLEQQAQKMVAMLKERGMTDFVLAIGTSLGTAVATYLARGRELRFGKLWLDGGVVLCEYKYKRFYRWVIYKIFHKIMVEAHREGAKSRFLGRPMPEEWLAKTEEPRKALTEQSLKNIVDVLVDYHIGPGITAPIYMTYGEKEADIQKNVDQVRALYPLAKVSVESGYNHLEYMDVKTGEYADRVRQVIEYGNFEERGKIH